MKRFIILFAFAVSACDTGSTAVEPTEPEAPRVYATATQVSDMPVSHPPVAGLSIASKGARRMSIEQIERSLEEIGILPEGSVQFPEDLAITLGKPDYLRTTEASLEPSPLFMKFMMDLGGIICTPLGDSDPFRPVEERVFTRFETVDDNLKHMLLRFTGISGADADPYITRLRRVHTQASAGARGDIGGYEAVCIALMTSPEFLLY